MSHLSPYRTPYRQTSQAYALPPIQSLDTQHQLYSNYPSYGAHEASIEAPKTRFQGYDNMHYQPSAPSSGHAAGPSNQYTFAVHPDPHHLPLPPSSDADLLHGPTVARAIGHSPASKVAGSRHAKKDAETSTSKAKGKGKRKQDAISDFEDVSDVSEHPTKRHGGRRPGAGNYKEEELKKLLDIVEKELPMCQNGWKKVYTRYATWAGNNNRPLRDAKALENKFKATKKPTGDGKRPEAVTRAKALDRDIVSKSGTVNINDDDTDSPDDDLSDDDGDRTRRSQDIHTITARTDKSEAAQSRRPRGAQTTELVHKIAHALDPEAQRARDEERSNRSLHNTQIFMISQQLRDSQAVNETLRAENVTLRERLHKVDRIRERLDTELNFSRRLEGYGLGSRRRGQYDRKYDPELTRVRGKIRNDEVFSDGGRRTTWITDGSSASDYDKENYNPATERYHPYQRSPSPTVTLKPQHRKHSDRTLRTASVTSPARARTFLAPISDFANPVAGPSNSSVISDTVFPPSDFANAVAGPSNSASMSGLVFPRISPAKGH